jgi:hypothetical protein
MLCKYNPLHPGGEMVLQPWYLDLQYSWVLRAGLPGGYTHKLNVSTPTYAYKVNQMKIVVQL